MMKIEKFKKEIKSISEFKELLQDYVQLESKQLLSAEEQELRREIREKLNTSIGEVTRYVRKIGVPTSIHYQPAPIVGGMAGNIDLFANLFNLDHFSIPIQTVFDALDKAIGNFLFHQKEYIKRILNPFYWIGRLINIPFKVLDFSGFDRNKIEFSVLGKVYKLIAAITILIAAIVTILNYLKINISDVISIFK